VSESASFSAETLEKMAARIRGLLAKAESTEFPEEAASLHTKAEELRRKYQLAEESLIAQDSSSILPVVRDIKVSTYASQFYQEHLRLWGWACNHFGVLYRSKLVGDDIFVTAVGYASDIRLVEGLYQSAWMTMVGQLEPKVNPDLSDQENVYRLRNSGLERNRIAFLLWGSDLGRAGHSAHARVGKLYAAACRERDEDPIVAGKGINKIVYREKYAEFFGYRFAERLRTARDAVDSQGGALVLKGREDRVKEAFWDRFPDAHPDARRVAAERFREDVGNLPKPKERKWTKADQDAYDRRHNSEAAVRGSAAGRAAADKIQIERTTEPARRVEAPYEPGSPSGTAIALGN